MMEIPQPIIDASQHGNFLLIVIWAAAIACASLGYVCYRLYRDNQALHERLFQQSLEQIRANQKLADAIKRVAPSAVSDDR